MLWDFTDSVGSEVKNLDVTECFAKVSINMKDFVAWKIKSDYVTKSPQFSMTHVWKYGIEVDSFVSNSMVITVSIWLLL